MDAHAWVKRILHMPIVKATKGNIKKAAAIIRRGGIVAFPTETVYGLGANAFDVKAVKKIFKAKGRPSDNPLIVHVASKKDISRVAVNLWTSQVHKLIDAFWPGPLTLVLPKNKNIPSVVSAGLETVAVRMPSNKIARALIRAAGAPIAAPSANKSGRPSPTDAKHVAHDFGNKLFILDGGKTKIGLESTVVDATVSPFAVLRHGGVSLEALRKVVPDIIDVATHKKHSPAKSPGMKYRHYAPRAMLVIVSGTGAELLHAVQKIFKTSRAKRIGILATDEYLPMYMRLGDSRTITLSLGSRKNLAACARRLFATLRQFDTLNVDVIIAETFPESGIGTAMMDRLRRAAGE